MVNFNFLYSLALKQSDCYSREIDVQILKEPLIFNINSNAQFSMFEILFVVKIY